MVGHGGSSAGSYLADPTSPIPSHCASIVVTSTLFQWEEGDFLMTDNLALAHIASADTQLPQEEIGLRVLHRVSVAGTMPPLKRPPPLEEQPLLKKQPPVTMPTPEESPILEGNSMAENKEEL